MGSAAIAPHNMVGTVLCRRDGHCLDVEVQGLDMRLGESDMHRDGHAVWAQATLARVQRGDDPRLIAMLQDVTERKCIEAARATMPTLPSSCSTRRAASG